MARAQKTWVLPPPAERITPALARDWLQRVYPKLAAFAELGFSEWALRPPRLREDLRLSLWSVAADTRRIATACAEAIATGRAVTIQRDTSPTRVRLDRKLRRLLAFERATHRTRVSGVRGVLTAALRYHERARRAA